ncbi:MAG: hypothetical protein JOZ12_07390 [Sinobacteraceae bacterium]|nr:hypothetical protein [Nevskiaceae bacterium]MBV8855098.1 hypothetical protein [Nevskiaceae bacterium]
MHTNRARSLKRGLALLGCAVLLVPCWAQDTRPAAAPTTPAASPRPDELEPGVNTSNSSSAPADNTPSVAPAGRSPAPSPAAAPVAAKPHAAESGRKAVARTTTEAGGPAAAAATGKAHDRIELDTTQITGNRELPKVLYIVPWKRADLGDLVGRPVNSLLDEVLTPVDRDVFNRQNRYYDALQPDAAAAASKPGH